MAELLTWLAQQLVDDPDAVRVEQVEREDATVLELYVAEADRVVRWVPPRLVLVGSPP